MWNRLFKNNPNGQTVSLLSKPDLDNAETCNLLKFRTFLCLQRWAIHPKDESNHRASQFPSTVHCAVPHHGQHDFYLICSWDFPMTCFYSLLSLLTLNWTQKDLHLSQHLSITGPSPPSPGKSQRPARAWLHS